MLVRVDSSAILGVDAYVVEVEVDLEHRATGRTWRGFTHRFRQLRAFVAVWAARRWGGNG